MRYGVVSVMLRDGWFDHVHARYRNIMLIERQAFSTTQPSSVSSSTFLVIVADLTSIAVLSVLNVVITSTATRQVKCSCHFYISIYRPSSVVCWDRCNFYVRFFCPSFHCFWTLSSVSSPHSRACLQYDSQSISVLPSAIMKSLSLRGNDLWFIIDMIRSCSQHHASIELFPELLLQKPCICI